MLLTVKNGEIVDVTTTLSLNDTAKVCFESNFDVKETLYLTLSSTPPSSSDDCEAQLIPLKDSPFCQRCVKGEAGKKIYAVANVSRFDSEITVRVSEE